MALKLISSMASAPDSWMEKYSEAAKLAEDINHRISTWSPGFSSRRDGGAIRRQIMILWTRLESLHSLLLAGDLPMMTEKRKNRRKAKLAALQEKITQMASAMNMSSKFFAGHRDSLLAPEVKDTDYGTMRGTTGSDRDYGFTLQSKANHRTSTINVSSNFTRCHKDGLLGSEVKPTSTDTMIRMTKQGHDYGFVLQSKPNHMTSTTDMSSNFSTNCHNDNLLGPKVKVTSTDTMRKMIEPDHSSTNYDTICLQRAALKEQDMLLDKLEEAVIGTKHVALTINNELDLHTKLIDDLDQHVEDVADSRLRRLRKQLATWNKSRKVGSSSLCALLAVTGIVLLVVVICL